MAANSGVFDNSKTPIPVFSLRHHVGVATRVYAFTVPCRMQIKELFSVALAADSTDKFTASVQEVTVAQTLITGSVVAAANTPVRVTAMDSGKSDILDPNHVYSVTITFAGTAANVTGPAIILWAVPANH